MSGNDSLDTSYQIFKLVEQHKETVNVLKGSMKLHENHITKKERRVQLEERIISTDKERYDDQKRSQFISGRRDSLRIQLESTQKPLLEGLNMVQVYHNIGEHDAKKKTLKRISSKNKRIEEIIEEFNRLDDRRINFTSQLPYCQ